MDEEGLDREALSLKLKLLLQVGLAQWHTNEELERESAEAMDGVGGVRRSHFCLIFCFGVRTREPLVFSKTISGSFSGRVRVVPDSRPINVIFISNNILRDN